MKKLTLSLIFIVTAAISGTTYAIDPQALPEKLSNLRWSTSTAAPNTTLVGNPEAVARWFQISNASPGSAVRLIVDGVEFIHPLHGVGSALVYGKQVSIKQTNAPKNGPTWGFWEVLLSERKPGTAVSWAVDPAIGSTATIAKLDVAREFVLTFVPEGTQTCAGGTLQMYIDGKPLELGQSGGYKFPNPSSFIAKGKVISVIVNGQCETGKTFLGNLYLLE